MKKIKNVMQISWEYPPRIVGNIASHVASLVKLLAENNVNSDVITFDDWRSGISTVGKSITVSRAKTPISPCNSTLAWVLTMCIEMERLAADAIHNKKGTVDVIHAHDWIALPAAITLRHEFEIPLVLTIHSLEKHRAHGHYDPYVAAVEKIEWQGTFEAAQIIVDSPWMVKELVEHYDIPEWKLNVVDPKSENYYLQLMQVYEKAVMQ